MSGSERSHQHPLKLWHRISVRLYLGVGGAVAFTLLVSLVSWVLLNRVGDVQRQVTEQSIPQVVSAFRLAQTGRALVAAAPRLAAAETAQDLARASEEMQTDRDAFEQELGAMRARDGEQGSISELTAHSNAMLQNLEDIRNSVKQRLLLGEQRKRLREEFAEVQDDLERILTHAMDDQLFYMSTGYRQLDEPPQAAALRTSRSELQRFRHLSELVEGATLGTQLLESAFTVAEIGLVEPLVERFEATMFSIEQGLASLADADIPPELTALFEQLFVMGTGDETGFKIRFQELSLAMEQRELLAQNRQLAAELGAQVENMVDAAYAQTLSSTNATSSAINTGISALIAINILSITGAVLIGILFIAGLLRRLGVLSSQMLRMADGALQEEVHISGQDEVAEMASALEIFRQHALEAQRLNLVEKLAEELRGKNQELEQVLADLRKAQDQIVMGQKLAELGELTAGVAHEIRNPLNFVKNFSEVSAEMVDELFEELESVLTEEAGVLAREQREIVQELRTDICQNLEKIQEHGARADRIVNDMLLMSRGEANEEMTDMNMLVEEHARLAYHSLRATDTEFNVNLDFDFDARIGKRMVVPQDFGRVFLNMVSNACHATEEKRRALATQVGERYLPQLEISSRLLDDNSAQFRIRDNGCGIEADSIEKIFNPFFTTKPPNQGTGLGLAISSDIVRGHGGSIDVKSEVGEFTEVIVTLPGESSAEEEPAEVPTD